MKESTLQDLVTAWGAAPPPVRTDFMKWLEWLEHQRIAGAAVTKAARQRRGKPTSAQQIDAIVASITALSQTAQSKLLARVKAHRRAVAHMRRQAYSRASSERSP